MEKLKKEYDKDCYKCNKKLRWAPYICKYHMKELQNKNNIVKRKECDPVDMAQKSRFYNYLLMDQIEDSQYFLKSLEKLKDWKSRTNSQEGIYQTINDEPVAGVQLTKKMLKLLLKGKKLFLTVDGIKFKFELKKENKNEPGCIEIITG